MTAGQFFWCSVAASCCLVLGYNFRGIVDRPRAPADAEQASSASPPPAPAPPPPAPERPPPPCVREVCAERPAGLFCQEWHSGGFCLHYKLAYEHHCDCAEWKGAE